ncbi:MAG: hypothetical protein JSS49_28485 [Planctomycetes bacterium]|nr:hypothetical protein [Planctomycetota bacterium]
MMLKLLTARGQRGLLTVPGAVLALLIAVAAPGCGQKAPDYTPSAEAAEDAVRQGMDAWKADQPPGLLPGHPAVHMTDVGRKPGQKLQSYQILGEAGNAPHGKMIAVTLKLSNPNEIIKARYLVVGIDPLWVFRQEDFELLMHWDHFMPEEQNPDNQPAAEPASALTPENVHVESHES